MAAITLYRTAEAVLGCDFAVIERLDVHAVIDSYRHLYAHGRHEAPPNPAMYQWMFDRGPNWVRATVPLDYLDFQTEEESGQERIRRARQYAARSTPFPPGTASYGGRARQRRSGKAYVQDGNHRVLAAHFRGDCAIEMFMPEDEFFAVVEDARWRESGAGEMRETTAREQGQFDKYRSLPADPDRGSPRSAYGPPSYHLVGDYWTVPVVAPLESLNSLRATAIDKARLRSVQQARREGVRLPPIEIGVFQNGSGWIVDGNHRLVAARRAEDDAIEVVFTFVPDANPRHVGSERAELHEQPRSEFIRAGRQALDAVANLGDIAPGLLHGTSMSDAAYHALEAGAEPPLEYIGAGGEGVVFCDAHFAYKVARGRKRERLYDEAEWLSVASQIPEVRPYVAAFERWDPEHGVIVRECIRGRSRAWNSGSKIRELWDHVAPYMLAEGWTMPEFKEDSVVFDEDGRPKLVDAGFVSRVSNRLLAYVEDILDGKVTRDEVDDDSTLAFYVRREFGQKEALDEERAHRLLARLYALGARE
jgi:hypothetical protein